MRKKIKNLPVYTPDKKLIGTIFALVLFGIIMVYDATAVFSYGTFGEAYRFAYLQIAWAVLGTLGFIYFYKIDYSNVRKPAYILFLISLVLLFILAVVGIFPCSENTIFTPCLNGANRWFYLNPEPLPKVPLIGVLGFQPAELAKFSLVLYLSVHLEKYLNRSKNEAFWIYFIPTALFSFLILLQPNMSTAAIVFIIGTAIYFSSGAGIKKLFIIIPIIAVLGLTVMLLSPYRRERLISYIKVSGNEETEESYHSKQISIALGSGGLLGVGLGQSRQKFQYLPETSADSIFAIVGEEMGYAGSLLVIALFTFLLYRGYETAKNAGDNLGRMLSVGVTTWFGIQFFVNVAAMARIIPLTGVPIPLISYGGSSMLFGMMGLGILANVSKKS
ncbi:hypothetical protein A3F07_02910 [candidate division WWE3 bacterium RIFCSPHIGHO2_12_FULL_38_15]|uniref:Probable peptidoglycan glycosyltransferase FtsW n=1 Tax=candidate division WWE3 bacterium RIFCSPHIGHO2_02_FULL_38_14 TaxID=1802620 RepID=A0A1F4VA67_UNCKA|nr:MAG: hypothetical protein A2793_04535 [candidate division WWE3 bacterium RIFCSPHIGHO2_01_FULL_38_45]OGC49359.1 MAG: hypothetical protein A3F07_02910 [candidate division WWE3 bacterium RIFCSPHIGHO2_12_FULL_38_15]OGC53962.1 MAG: hypothetical protein A3B64_03015 [candidate division WWE3 bacterium RIFCSPLOWO2_01_FULL_37_24]OGC54038.1 MAG: hypothetical protein A3D91_04750 [candidate division WWE3 bacterium RIFCSPHIGHO2_02_FULL_38_14]HLB51447.1 FtsW/RodA/SpoVE family cell cycle protein [Patescibac